MEPPVRAFFTIAEYAGVTICSAEIPAVDYAERPCYYKGKGRSTVSYLRAGDVDLVITDLELHSYKDKKSIKRERSEWQIFENTHEAIIDQETFDIMQRIREGRRRFTPMGEMPLLSGMVYCADCGTKMYQVRCKRFTHEQEHMVCATYRKMGKAQCPSHQIRNVMIEELLLDCIRNITALACEHEDDFVKMITQKSQADLNRSQRDGKKELEQAHHRINKLDTIIQRLYEDNIEGKISDERFTKMSENYEAEQTQLKSRVTELEQLLSAEKDNAMNVNQFLALVKKYTEEQKLTAEIIRKFVEKFYVYQAEKVDGHRFQKIRVIWNYIGELPSTNSDYRRDARI